MRKISTLSVVVPVYNEEECLPDTLRNIIKAAGDLFADFEVIVVDDNSSDATPLILRNLSAQDKRLRVVNNPGKRGLGNALRAGFSCAGKEAVLYTDADMPCDLNELKRAVNLMEEEGADIVSAYRLNNKQGGRKRYLYSRAFNLLMRNLFRLRLKDINFSFKLFRKKQLDGLCLGSRGSFINTELFARAVRSGYKIVQFPAVFLPRQKGRSKLDNLANISEIIRESILFLCRRPACRSAPVSQCES